jgi:hypothetical protein
MSAQNVQSISVGNESAVSIKSISRYNNYLENVASQQPFRPPSIVKPKKRNGNGDENTSVKSQHQASYLGTGSRS